jgi:hypothetical protein
MASEIVATANGIAWVQQKGDSLAPTIKPGEWIEIDPRVTWFTGPGIYLTAWKHFDPTPCHPKQIPQLRRLDFINGVLHSVPDNPLYPAFAVAIDGLLIGGKVAQP